MDFSCGNSRSLGITTGLLQEAFFIIRISLYGKKIFVFLEALFLEINLDDYLYFLKAILKEQII